MSNMKNFIQAKKQKTTDIVDRPQKSDENTSKKKREEQAKPVKNDENDWDNNEYPEYNVNVKNYSELKAKKQQEPVRGHGTGGWENEITKVTQEEEEQAKIEEQPMKQIKAPAEKKKPTSFAEQIKNKKTEKKTKFDITDDVFLVLGAEKPIEQPKPKEETKPDDKKDSGPKKFLNTKKGDEKELQGLKPLDTVTNVSSSVVEKKTDAKPEIKASEGPKKFISKKKDDKEGDAARSLADLKREEAERRMEEKLKEEEEKKKKFTKVGLGADFKPSQGSDHKPEQLEKTSEEKPTGEEKEKKILKFVNKKAATINNNEIPQPEKTIEERPVVVVEEKEKKMMKFVNKKAANINNNMPFTQNVNSDNKEETTVNENPKENQEADDFKVVEDQKKKKHENANPIKEKEGFMNRRKDEKQNKTKEHKDHKEQKDYKEHKDKEHREPKGLKEKVETKKENEKVENIIEEKEKIHHAVAVASSWD